MWDREVWTRSTCGPRSRRERGTLGQVLQPTAEVRPSSSSPRPSCRAWEYLKGAKREERTAANGHSYFYSEGGDPFPDRSTSHPGRSSRARAARRRHASSTSFGPRTAARRLTPVELERLNGFPDGWTDTGMPDGRRAFMMGNALVVGLIERVAQALAMPQASASRSLAAVR